MQCCASSGIAGGDDIKLKDCDDCDLVKYCSDECQNDHQSQHEEECKKRAAKLHDELLFKQPESSCYGDCPICCLPLSLHPSKSIFMPCCSKRICNGCDLANAKREVEARLLPKCLFCRKIAPRTDEEFKDLLMKRVEANDPVAMCQMGPQCVEEGDYNKAFEHWTRAATLGEAEADYQLSVMYQNGLSVEKDEKKKLHHLEKAAIAGHPHARHNLGCYEWNKNGQVDRAVRHWIIGAKLGHDDSLRNVKDLYKDGHVSRDQFAAALRGYQATIEATKSPQREEATAFKKRLAER